FLAVGAWFQVLEMTTGAALLARGKPGAVTIGIAIKFIGLLIFVPVGYWLGGQIHQEVVVAGVPWHGGVSGMILGFVASDVVRSRAVIVIARRNGTSPYVYDVCLSALVLFGTVGTHVLMDALTPYLVADRALTRGTQLALLVLQGILVLLFWS